MKKKILITISVAVVLILAICTYLYIDNTNIIGSIDEQAKTLAIKDVGENNLKYPVFAYSITNIDNDIILTLYSSVSPYKQITIYHFNSNVLAYVEMERYYSNKAEATSIAKINIGLTNITIKNNVSKGTVSYQGDMGTTKEEIQSNIDNFYKPILPRIY